MKKLIAVLMSMMIIAGIFAGCAASTEQSGNAALTQPGNQTTAEESNETEESTELGENSKCDDSDHQFDTIENAATCTQKGSKTTYCTICKYEKEEIILDALGHQYTEGICDRCGYSEIPSITKVKTLTLTTRLQSENDTVITTFCLDEISDDETYFYVSTQSQHEESATEYLYHIKGDDIIQYLNTEEGLIRSSSIHNEDIRLVYHEQVELLSTFINYRLPLPSALDDKIGNNSDPNICNNGEKLKSNILYYPIEDGYIGVDEYTKALVVMLDAEQQPLMTVTELNLNNAGPIETLLAEIGTASLLTPEISVKKDADSYRISCYIPEKEKALTLTLIQPPDGSIVYEIGDDQSTVTYQIAADGSIAREPEAKDTDLKGELTQLLELFNLFVDYPSLLAGCQYTQVEPTDLPNSTPDNDGSGDADSTADQNGTNKNDNQTPEMYEGSDGFTAYRVQSETDISHITIDNTTGILTSVYDENGPLLFVTDLQIGNVTPN